MTAPDSPHNARTEIHPPRLEDIIEWLSIDPDDEANTQDKESCFRTGFPEFTLHHLAEVLAPGDPNFKFALMDDSRTESQRLSGRLSPRETHLVYRLASVWIMALKGYKKPEIVRSFMFSENPMLFGDTPFDWILKGSRSTRGIILLLPKHYGPNVHPNTYWLD